MPEPTDPAAQPPAAAPGTTPAAKPDAKPAAPAASASAKPDFLPDDYWKPDVGAVDVERLWTERQEIGERFAKGKTAYAEAVRGEITEQVKAELAAERRKAVPEKPEGYALAIPEGLPDGVVVFDKVPDEGFTPEPGKRYVVLQDDHPMTGVWRNLAHKLDLSQEQFLTGVAEFAAMQAAEVKTPAMLDAERRQFYAKLGENGEARVAHVWGKLDAALGEDAQHFDGFVSTPEQVAALEKLLDAASGPTFSKRVPMASGTLDEKSLREMQQDPRYWKTRDPEFIAKVTEGFKKLYPGSVPATGRTAR